eukprot:7965303-Alexandrium_andersonii.AAC.1
MIRTGTKVIPRDGAHDPVSTTARTPTGGPSHPSHYATALQHRDQSHRPLRIGVNPFLASARPRTLASDSEWRMLGFRDVH